MKSLKAYLIVALVLIVATGVIWAVGPYVDVFSSDTFVADSAFEELAVESKQQFGHRFLVGMAVGAGITLIWVLYDVAVAKKR